MATKKKKDKLTKEQIKERREKRFFKNKIVSVFKNTGFKYLNTEDKHYTFGLKKGELDYVFVYENIILVCEDTITNSSREIKKHMRNKLQLFEQIDKNKEEFIIWLKKNYSEKFENFEEYDFSRYSIHYLYFSKYKTKLSVDDLELFKLIKVVEEVSLNYFYKISQNIKYSARNEIFRFLNLKGKNIGYSKSGSKSNEIEATIISPEDNIGLRKGVKMVSFMVSAKDLMNCCYVLRKDNWENSIQLYQRLIEKYRIDSIREHLATTKRTFLNNIIVSLPSEVQFYHENGEKADISNITEFGSLKMCIPNELNSVGVIDGQHRIFAHYEGDDKFEPKMKKLRNKLHLLTTGLIFPKSMSALDKIKYESEIFLDINSNAKPVPPDVLLHIKMLKDPFSPLGIGRQILEKLNQENIFKDYFQLSLMEKARIKIPSIIKFALRYLVEIDNEKECLYKYWNNENKNLLLKKDAEILNEYVSFCSDILNLYFRAIKDIFSESWYSETSKILSVTSINGFIIALRKSLKFYGVKDFDSYKNLFTNFSVDFEKEVFPFTSSQYNKFANLILQEVFNIVPDEKNELQLLNKV